MGPALPTSLTRLRFGLHSNTSANAGSLPQRLTALTALKQLSIYPWAGSTAKLVPLTTLPALARVSLQVGTAGEGAIELTAGEMGQDLAPVSQAMQVCIRHLKIEQPVSAPPAASFCARGVDALARLNMLTQLHLLGCSAVDAEHTGQAARDAKSREGIVWPVTPQQLAACIRKLPHLCSVTLKDFRLQREGPSNVTVSAAAASSSFSSGGSGVVMATGADMLPVTLALAGLTRLTALRCYNVLIGSAAVGLRGASELCMLELKECHVDDTGLMGMLQGFASSSILTSLDLSRQHWEGSGKEEQGHLISRSPCLSQASLEALHQHLPNMRVLTLSAQPLITLQACRDIVARWPSISYMVASDHTQLTTMKCVDRERWLAHYKPFRGCRAHHNAYGPVTGSDSETGDDEELDALLAAEALAEGTDSE